MYLPIMEVLGPTLSYLQASGMLQAAGGVVTAAVKDDIAEAYEALKKRLLSGAGEDPAVATSLEALEADPADEQAKAAFAEAVSQAPTAPDPGMDELLKKLTGLVAQTPQGKSLRTKVTVQGDKNIVVTDGGFKAGNINFG